MGENIVPNQQNGENFYLGSWLAFASFFNSISHSKKRSDMGDVSLPLSGKTIVLDPGHGGPDGGAVGKDETEEKDIALSVAKKLQDYLQQSGALVYLTRETDKDLAAEDTEGLSNRKSEDIRNRLEFIHDRKADFFVTIHLNALTSTRWHGAQTFYYPEM